MNEFKEIDKEIRKSPDTQSKQPGDEYVLKKKPVFDNPSYISSNKLKDKVAIITGGDSGIGRAVAILFAKEGADIVIVYYDEHEDANQVKKQIEQLGQRCLLIAGDLSCEEFCKKIVKQTLEHFQKLDILINNAAEQFPCENIEEISAEQLTEVFAVNVFSYFYLIKASLPYLKENSSVINTASVTFYKGNPSLIDYSASKGAVIGLTRSLSLALIEKGIRINAVAPGPVWTPLIASTFSEAHIKNFGQNTPMKRMAQPVEIAPCYLFLATADSSYISGQVLHPNGGTIINS